MNIPFCVSKMIGRHAKHIDTEVVITGFWTSPKGQPQAIVENEHGKVELVDLVKLVMLPTPPPYCYSLPGARAEKRTTKTSKTAPPQGCKPTNTADDAFDGEIDVTA